MTTNTVNNINEARRMANSYAKAQQIINEGYRFEKDADSEVIAVIKPGKLAASYWINLLSEGCDCPDYMKHGKYCKHTLANGILQEEAANMEAQCAQWEEENPLDCIPTPTLESIAAKDLYQRMSADLQRVEAAIHTHGARNVNPIQCQQDRHRAALLQAAVQVVSQYR